MTNPYESPQSTSTGDSDQPRPRWGLFIALSFLATFLLLFFLLFTARVAPAPAPVAVPVTPNPSNSDVR